MADLYMTVLQTFSQGAQLPPAGDAALLGMLAHDGLQKEERDAAQHRKYQIRHQEGAWMLHMVLWHVQLL